MKKPKTAKATRPNAGVEAAYRAKLQALVGEMHVSVDYWIKIGYKAHPPRARALAEDASPAERMRKVMRDLADRWLQRFEESAPRIAESYVKDIFKASGSAMRSSLKAAGWAVEFEMTPSVRDAVNASMAENVGLIRSIPEQYLQRVEGAVMRSYSAGRDLQTLVGDIKNIYGVTQKRAVLIARDQSNKANAVATRTRQMELGITEAIWMHSHGGKHPRPDHVAANGKRYKIAEGCEISGEFVQPGEEINCRCASRPVLPF